MNNEPTLQKLADQLFERWKTVMAEGQQAKDAGNVAIVAVYQQERHFLEKLIDELDEQLPSRSLEWESYKRNSPPATYFSPDSTDVESHF